MKTLKMSWNQGIQPSTPIRLLSQVGPIILGMCLGCTHRPASIPEVEVPSKAISTDIVKIADMIREVRGVGSLVADTVFHVSAPVGGTVVRVSGQPGALVRSGTVIAELHDAEVEARALEAVNHLTLAIAEMKNVEAQIRSHLVTHQSTLAELRAKERDARVRNDRDVRLFGIGLISEFDYRLSMSAVEDSGSRIRFEIASAKASEEVLVTQLRAKELIVDQARLLSDRRNKERAALLVRASWDGVLQRVSAQVGQDLVKGSEIASIINPRRLKAVFMVPDVQGADIALDQDAFVETSGRTLNGFVSRIDPSIADGNRGIEIRIVTAIPPEVVPETRIVGSVEIERVRDRVLVRCPAGFYKGETSSMFRVSEGGRSANRVKVKVGRVSRNEVEILDGLSVGDRVVVSDVSMASGVDRIAFKD